MIIIKVWVEPFEPKGSKRRIQPQGKGRKACDLFKNAKQRRCGSRKLVSQDGLRPQWLRMDQIRDLAKDVPCHLEAGQVSRPTWSPYLFSSEPQLCQFEFQSLYIPILIVGFDLSRHPHVEVASSLACSIQSSLSSGRHQAFCWLFRQVIIGDVWVPLDFSLLLKFGTPICSSILTTMEVIVSLCSLICFIVF